METLSSSLFQREQGAKCAASCIFTRGSQRAHGDKMSLWATQRRRHKEETCDFTESHVSEETSAARSWASWTGRQIKNYSLIFIVIVVEGQSCVCEENTKNKRFQKQKSTTRRLKHAHLSACSAFPSDWHSITSLSPDVGVTRTGATCQAFLSPSQTVTLCPGGRGLDSGDVCLFVYVWNICWSQLWTVATTLSIMETLLFHLFSWFLWFHASPLLNSIPSPSLPSFHLAREACVLVWFGWKHRQHTHQRRKPDIYHFIITVIRGERPELDSSLRTFLLIKHCVEMNRNAVLIPGLIASYSTNSVAGFRCWMNNCHVEQHVSGVRANRQDGKRKSAWRLDISHQVKIRKKCAHVTQQAICP